MKVVVFTLGCKVNQCESDALIRGLRDRGYEVADELIPADLYIVNTCAVTNEAERKSRQMVARIRKLNQKARIIFTGCAAERTPDLFLQRQNVQLVTGTAAKAKILDLLEQCGKFVQEDKSQYEELLPVKTLKSRTYIKIQDGCDNFCSYCIIPYLRGRSRSRDYEKIALEIRETEPVEAVLNGINLSAYRYNGKNLTDLLYYLKDVPCRIRLGSLEVNIIDDAFLLACQSLNDFAPHFHLSLQSGSDAVLKKMNRHYTAEEYLEKVKLIRSYFPDAAITTDIIAGFPTETEENFEETLAFVRRVRFSAIHCFPFSARSGTVAGRMKDLPMSVKKERVERLLAEGKAGHEAFIAENLNTVQEFIPETETDGFWAGYTGNYIRVYVENCKAGGRYRVRLTGRFRDGALAEIIN